MRRRPRPIGWLILGGGALTLGSCAGAMIGRYTITGMVPLAPMRPAIGPQDDVPRDPLFEPSSYGDGEGVAAD